MRTKKNIKTFNIVDYVNKDFLNTPINSKTTKFLFGKYICNERLILLFIILSVFLGEYHYTYYKIMPETSKMISYIIFCISIILVWLMVNKYILFLNYNKSKKLIPLYKKYFDSKFNFFFILEVFVLFCHNFFFLDGYTFEFINHIDQDTSITYNVNDIFYFISLLKILIIFKIVIENTIWANDKSFRICRMYGCKNNFIFIIRCLMKEQPIAFVFFILLIGIIYFGGITRIVEGAIENDKLYLSFKFLLNCYWCIIITMTTVGYGDMYPVTNIGRLIIIVCSIFGITVISLMVVSITNTFEMSNMENKSFIILKRLTYKEKMKKYGAKIITLLFKYKSIYKKNKNHPMVEIKLQLESIEEKFKRNIIKFKYNKKIYRSIYDNNIIEEIDRMNGNINEKLKILKSNMPNMNN